MASTPRPRRKLSSELTATREKARRQFNSSPFFGTGMHPNGAGGLDSDNFSSGSTGFSLKGTTGAAEFTDIIILGVSVGADAPVLNKTYRVSASNFALTTAWVEKAGADITVPTGCTRANVALSGRLYAVNQNTSGGADTTGTDALYVRIGINGSYTTATPTGVSGNFGFATNVGMDSFDLTGLTPGSTIRLSAQGTSGYQTIAAYADNYINGVASITWMR